MRIKRKKVYRLPTIEYETTTSVRKYINEWRAVGQSVAIKFNCRLVGWDPDFLLAHARGYSFTLPLWAALEFQKQKDGK